MPLVRRQLLGHPEGLARRQIVYLGHRIGMLGAQGHQGVARS